MANIAEVLKHWVSSATSNRTGRTTSSLSAYAPGEFIGKESNDSGIQVGEISRIFETMVLTLTVNYRSFSIFLTFMSFNFVIGYYNPSFLQLARALSAGLSSSIDSWKGSLESLVGGNTEKTNKVLALFTSVEQTLAKF